MRENHWKDFLLYTIEGGDDIWGTHVHGKGVSIVSWRDRGFTGVSPGGCNTWAASAADVA
ncbi:hypothetical protein GCM10010156_22760 [Planobispora rosea]|uniref:Uncharacterized protein n=1 Tax=Planobispora rosea TaxID=35762 RepID=A0A8J3WCQ2_PLARO|nr:hypothetical protein [Planobispora rosea]GGS63275.1 hypothetical protein GCM10010156_22760 [Planobispora rosea]GIH84440.1 hypothetical protein Pro02_28480 [Planobispora rosea]